VNKPSLSIIIISYDMPRQLENTLYSLSTEHQQNVNDDDYEVIIVENCSNNTLSDLSIKKLPKNFRYILREECGVSPVPALNQGFAESKGETIGILLDGARMLTPRVIEHVLASNRMFKNPIVAVPAYHIGEHEHENYNTGREKEEQELLKDSNWKKDGYELFNHACNSIANPRGYFHPLMECNALFCSRESFKAINVGNDAFNLLGGGSYNLHLYRSLGLNTDQALVILPGEGSFHQFHSGVTTSKNQANRSTLLTQFNEQLNSHWGGQYKALAREPILFGNIPKQAHRFMQTACDNGMKRFNRFERFDERPWPDDARTN